MDEIIFFHFRGETINPSRIRAGELAALLEAIEDALAITVFAKHPHLNKDNLLIGLSAIEKGSLELQFTTLLPELVVPVYEDVARAFRENDPEALPLNSYPAFEKIISFAKKNDSQLDLDLRNGKPRQTLVTITPDFALPKTTYISGETTLYGQLMRVGGVEPKAEIKTTGGRTLYCPFPLELAAKLGASLYDDIGIIGKARWDSATYEIVEFQITKLIDYRPTSITEAFTELRQRIGHYYDDIDDVTAYVSDLRKG